jgi:hypothetical protein
MPSASVHTGASQHQSAALNSITGQPYCLLSSYLALPDANSAWGNVSCMPPKANVAAAAAAAATAAAAAAAKQSSPVVAPHTSTTTAASPVAPVPPSGSAPHAQQAVNLQDFRSRFSSAPAGAQNLTQSITVSQNQLNHLAAAAATVKVPQPGASAGVPVPAASASINLMRAALESHASAALVASSAEAVPMVPPSVSGSCKPSQGAALSAQSSGALAAVPLAASRSQKRFREVRVPVSSVLACCPWWTRP